jgi:ABC-type molybdate transport system substrate-binding protein
MRKPENLGRRRITLRVLLILGILGGMMVVISSCNFPDLGDILPGNQATEIPSVDSPTATPQPTPTPNAPVVIPRQLTLWLPPQFDPESGTTAGNLFASRLEGFVSLQSGTDLQVRVKALSGEFGLLESLALIDSTAPLLKPDLVALPRPLLEEAFRAGLIVPVSDSSEFLNENDWYDYALSLSQVDGQTAGIPFAGDLLVLAYKENPGETPPTNWEALLGTQRAVSFPASDPSGLVTLAWYQSLGGEFLGEDGETTLDGDLMLQVLNFYEQAQNAGVMPYWLAQFETEDQAWESYLERQSTLAITWASDLLSSESANTTLEAVPTKDDRAYTYADGWVWCIVPSNVETEQFAFELAVFLSESDFLSSWTMEGGYLPVRPSSLEGWSEMTYYPTLEKLLPAAELVPDENLVDVLGPVVRDAVVEVLKDQVEPEIALESLLAEIED